MLEDSNAGVILTQQKLAGTFTKTDARMLCIDAMEDAKVVSRNGAPAPQDLAYVIYTSGLNAANPKAWL